MERIEKQETSTITSTGGVGSKMRRGTGRAKQGVKTLFTKKRKFVILAGMLVLLCVTGYLNFALNSSSVPINADVTTDLFTMFRNTRADERARDIVIYESMIGNENYSEESQTSAQAKLFEIRANVTFENDAEHLILAEKYMDVIVNRSNGFVNVLLKKDSNIDRTQAIKIMSILQSVQPDLDIDNVFISIMEP